jgi:phenylacetate-CoA ligase
MTIEVERMPDAPGNEAARAGNAGEVRHRLKSMVGVTFHVAVKAPGEVPRSQGKAVRVKDRRPQ